jgi:hypothetical protein
VLDWRKQQTTRAMVLMTIKDVLNELPRAYTKERYEQKCDSVFGHSSRLTWGRGRAFIGRPRLRRDANILHHFCFR